MQVDIVIVGGGIGGLALACGLESLGVSYIILEQSKEIKWAGSGLSVMANAVLAAQQLGVAEDIKMAGAAIKTFRVFDQNNRQIFDSPVADSSQQVGQPSICIGRGILQETLMNKLPDHKIMRNHRVIGATQKGDSVIIQCENSKSVTSRLVIGADGYHSIIANALHGQRVERPSGYIALLALCDALPKRDFPDGSVWHYWGHGKRVGLIDIGHDRLYWWTTVNKNLAVELGNKPVLKDPRYISKAQLIYKEFPELVTRAFEATPPENVLCIETRDRYPLLEWGRGPFTLIGDAAHAMLTSLGQGACQAIEDAAMLTRCIRENDITQAALRSYEKNRIRRANSYQKLSRRVSWYEQFESPLACNIRNQLFRMLPTWVLRKQNDAMLKGET